MKRKKNKLWFMFLSGLCCLTLLGGCGSKEKSSSDEKDSTEVIEENQTEEAQSDEEGTPGANISSVGEFSMQDINGETFTQDMFADYDLTMVNVFTTWCTPCVNEIPDLQKLWEEMQDQGVNVTGIVLDSVDASGNASEEVVEKAKILADSTGASYPFLVPDQGYMNGRLLGITAVPETFFVDKEGNIVGETYSGSHSLEQWKSIVEEELKGVEK
ncbi:TlpA disulfide reductase family protein [Lachnospiraceae bacterium 45-W7]